MVHYFYPFAEFDLATRQLSSENLFVAKAVGLMWPVVE